MASEAAQQFFRARQGERFSIPMTLSKVDGEKQSLTDKTIVIRITDINKNEVLFTYNSVDNPAEIVKDPDCAAKFTFNSTAEMSQNIGEYIIEFDIYNATESFKRKFWFEFDILETIEGLPDGPAINQPQGVWAYAVISIVDDIPALLALTNVRKGGAAYVLDIDGNGNSHIMVASKDDPLVIGDWIDLTQDGIDEGIALGDTLYFSKVVADKTSRDALLGFKAGKFVLVLDDDGLGNAKLYFALKDQDQITSEADWIDVGLFSGTIPDGISVVADKAARDALTGFNAGKTVLVNDRGDGIPALYIAKLDAASITGDNDWIDIALEAINSIPRTFFVKNEAERDALPNMKRGSFVVSYDPLDEMAWTLYVALQDLPTQDSHWHDVIYGALDKAYLDMSSQVVNTIAERDALINLRAGKMVMVADVGDGTWGLFMSLAAGNGDSISWFDILDVNHRYYTNSQVDAMLLAYPKLIRTFVDIATRNVDTSGIRAGELVFVSSLVGGGFGLYLAKQNNPTLNSHYHDLTDLNHLYYTKTQVDSTLAGYATLIGTYSQNQADEKFEQRIQAVNDIAARDALSGYKKGQLVLVENDPNGGFAVYLSNADTPTNNWTDVTDLNHLYYTQAQVDSTLAGYATLAGTYSTTDADNKFATIASTYTQAQVDSILTAYATIASTYTQAQVDSILTAYATIASTYTQAQVDSLLTGYSAAGHDHDIAYQKLMPTFADITARNAGGGGLKAGQLVFVTDAGTGGFGIFLATSDTPGVNDWTDITELDHLYYTQAQVDSILTAYATLAGTYSTTDADNKFATIASTYTQAEIQDQYHGLIPTFNNLTDRNNGGAGFKAGQVVFVIDAGPANKNGIAVYMSKQIAPTLDSHWQSFTNLGHLYSDLDHDHDASYYGKAETYTQAQVDSLLAPKGRGNMVLFSHGSMQNLNPATNALSWTNTSDINNGSSDKTFSLNIGGGGDALLANVPTGKRPVFKFSGTCHITGQHAEYLNIEFKFSGINFEKKLYPFRNKVYDLADPSGYYIRFEPDESPIVLWNDDEGDLPNALTLTISLTIPATPQASALSLNTLNFQPFIYNAGYID